MSDVRISIIPKIIPHRDPHHEKIFLLYFISMYGTVCVVDFKFWLWDSVAAKLRLREVSPRFRRRVGREDDFRRTGVLPQVLYTYTRVYNVERNYPEQSGRLAGRASVLSAVPLWPVLWYGTYRTLLRSFGASPAAKVDFFAAGNFGLRGNTTVRSRITEQLWNRFDVESGSTVFERLIQAARICHHTSEWLYANYWAFLILRCQCMRA